MAVDVSRGGAVGNFAAPALARLRRRAYCDN